jgi:thymidylate kinase
MIDPRLVMMDGVAPGIGKSTLAASLARVLADSGTPVDLFPEEDLFTRSAFARVAQAFRERCAPTPETFLPAYAETIEHARAQHAWTICDWNCAGMASDLAWASAEPTRLHGLVRDVRRMAADMSPVVLFLDGDVREATRRAAAERGRPWVSYWARLAAEHGAPPGAELERIVHNHERSQGLRQADLDVLRTTGWRVLTLDGTASPNEVLAQAIRLLRLPPPP